MSVTVTPIPPRRPLLRKAVKFSIDLYKDNEFYVPPLITDEVDTLTPAKNPAFDFCEAQTFIATRDGKTVGRVTAIINRAVNERTGQKDVRFGFIDFIDDAEVVDALFKAVSDWGRQRGMTAIVGPLGFTDMDCEGTLIEGFGELGTMETIYNYPYYPEHFARLGFEKDVDWVEYLMTVPDEIPEKHLRIAEIVKKKYNLSIAEIKSKKQLKEQYGKAIFDLINRTYDQLYGYSPITPRQADHYIKVYLGLLKPDNLCLIVDGDDRLVGVGISIPSFARALQRNRGRLFPFGWIPMLRPLSGKSDIVDLLLVGVDLEYQSKGVNALLFTELIPRFKKIGYKYAESNPEMESNSNVQKQWEYFERRQHKRRRCYRKPL